MSQTHEIYRARPDAQTAGRATAPQRCRCGGIVGADGLCDRCRRKAVAQRRRVANGVSGHSFAATPVESAMRVAAASRAPLNTEPEEEQDGLPVGRIPAAVEDDLPHNDAATIVCNGSGGYRVSMGSWATATCGIRGCISAHERSHITDWLGRWPNGCKNADGSAKPDGTTVPTGGAGYAAFLRASECTAYTGEVPCEEALLRDASDACKPTIRSVLEDSRRQKTSFCT
jgi:hypothetical protein